MIEKRADSTEPTSPLRGEVGAQRRVRGRKVAAGAVARARKLRRNETDAENKFWNMVRNRQVAGRKFVRQYPIGRYVADFVCREEMLVVELDGGQHAESGRDLIRTRFLNSEGYSVLRFWNMDVLENPEGCFETLLAVFDGNPSPGLRFAKPDLSPAGRGGKGENS